MAVPVGSQNYMSISLTDSVKLKWEHSTASIKLTLLTFGKKKSGRKENKVAIDKASNRVSNVLMYTLDGIL